MTTINISLPDQMKEFVDEEMGEGGYRDPSDYFNALLQEQLKRKADQKLEALLQEGLATESSAVDKKDWEYIRAELESRWHAQIESTIRYRSAFRIARSVTKRL